LATNVLYFYDKEGKPQNVYLVASGKKTPKTQTKTGVRSVSHVETYPYKEANPKTKRRKNPRAYGPKILILDYLNPKTGEITHGNGEFIHGNNNAKSLGQYASLGCIRMDNEVIKEISTLVDRHDIVVIYDSIKDSK
jgi:lipoprotein-anchoring transpeptidase ErfK/SrfK